MTNEVWLIIFKCMAESVININSNTTKKKPRGKAFSKGDPNINRKGRPKNFDALRALALEIAHREIKDEEGNVLTIAEGIMRKWAVSKDARLQKAFIEIAFGKVPDVIQQSGEVKIRVEYIKKKPNE